MTGADDRDADGREALARLVAASGGTRSGLIELPGTGGGWVDSGIDVAAGETVTLFSAGTVWISRELNVGVGSQAAVWYRIGNSGRIAKAIGATDSFTVPEAGRLMLVAKPPGEFLDESGAFDPDYPHGGWQGAVHAAVFVWTDDMASGLADLARHDSSGLVAAELKRRAAPVEAPRGWHHLWRLGQNGIYCEAVDSAQGAMICCRTERDVGILQYPVDVALDASTRLAWSWRIGRLPSPVAEDTLLTHDYLSIAVEFENGLDLTYLWSAALPVETTFRCPLPWWDQRETHLVVRSGETGLQSWVDEERAVLDDYARAIGGPLPQRIVAVWLIAVTLFQRGRGEADYANIRLLGAGGETRVSR